MAALMLNYFYTFSGSTAISVEQQITYNFLV